MMFFQRYIKEIFEPAIWFVSLLVIWEIIVKVLDVPQYVLPAPSEFITRIVTDHEKLILHGWISTKLIIWGFLSGIIPGIALGYLIATSQWCERLLYPLVVFIQGLPKITLAPLMLVWFGFADFPKILLTALVTFFPVLVDSVIGFRSVDKRVYYLSRSTGANWWQTFKLIQLPSAGPYILSGCKITIVVAVTVVIVVELLNSQTGLGYLVLRGMTGNDTPLIFATLVVGSVIGVLLSYFIELAERLLLPWRRVTDG